MRLDIYKLEPLKLSKSDIDEIVNLENDIVDFAFIPDVEKLPSWLKEFVIKLRVDNFEDLPYDSFFQPDNKYPVLYTDGYNFNYLFAKKVYLQNGIVTNLGSQLELIEKINPDCLVCEIEDIQSLKKYWKQEVYFEKLVSTFVEERHFLFFDF